jgi:hypothetical protein
MLSVGCATGATPDRPAIDSTTPEDTSVTSPAGCAEAFTGELAAWSFAGAPGSQADTPATSTALGVTTTPVTRAGALTAVSGAGSINASNWPTAAQLDATRYFTLSLAPPAGCTLRVDTLAVDTRSSGTGPAAAAIATSADDFAQTVALGTNAQSAPAIGVAVTELLEVRIYGFSATAAGGTMRLQASLSITGAIE